MNKAFLFSILVLVTGLFSCSSKTENTSGATAPPSPSTSSEAPVTAVIPGKMEMFAPADLNLWFDKKEDFTVLDVRTPEEYLTGSLPGAKNIDFMAADFKDQVSKLDKGKTYAVICQVGKRSGASAQMMADMGFQHVWTLSGGLDAWTHDGYGLAH
jgi:rhodanese-related sulfurtransferase